MNNANVTRIATRHAHFSILLGATASLILFVLLSSLPTDAQLQSYSFASPADSDDQAKVSSTLQSPPPMFIENMGQFTDGTRFQVGGGNGSIWLADDAIWFTLLARTEANSADRPSLLTPGRFGLPGQDERRKGVNLRLSFVTSNPHPRVEAFNRLDTHVSYFIGNDPRKWLIDVPAWGGVVYRDLYPGIDFEFKTESGQLVPEFVVSDVASLTKVGIRLDGAERITPDGNQLHITTTVGEFALPLPRFVSPDRSLLQTKGFDLTVEGNEVAWPFADPIVRRSNSSAPQAGLPSQSPLLYSTYLGGNDSEEGSGIAVDGSGAAYVTGYTASSNFPTTPGAFDTTCGTDGACDSANDAFVAKLSADGSQLEYATFLGGSMGENGNGIAVDSSGHAYIVGLTGSNDFPTTSTVFQK